MSRCWFALLWLLSFSIVARAQSLQIAPVSVEFGPGQQAAVLTVSNEASAATVFQIRPFAWTTAGNADRLVPTELLAVSPPFAEVPPGQTQTIRLVLRRPPDAREASFRVLIDQLPTLRSLGAVRIALRLSIPVFAAPTEQQDTRITGQIVVDGSAAALTLQNHGARHTRILQASIKLESGRPFPVQTLSSPYLLAGAERTWPIANDPRLRAAGAARVTAMTDAGPIDVLVPVSPPR